MKQNILFKESSKEEVLIKVEHLENLFKDVRHNYDYLVSKRKPDDLQHQILLLSLSRIIKYFDAYLLLSKNGFGEPGITLLRSLFEASLWMRWILISKENAQKYFDSSKGEAIRIAQRNYGRGLLKIENAPEPEIIKKMLEDEAKKYILPKWEDITKDTGMMDLYVLVYKMMSAMSHGTFLFLGEKFMDQRVSPDPDYKNIEPFYEIANNLLRDCYIVAEMWIEENKIREVPNVKELLIM